MKKTKILITIIVLLFCFTLNSELYQGYLTSFKANYKYLSITPTEENYQEFPQFITDLSENYKKPFFYVEESTDEIGNGYVDVYCTDLAYQELTANRGLHNGTFKGALSGQKTLTFHDMQTLPTAPNTFKIYFPAEEYELEGIHKAVNLRFVSGMVHQDDTTGDNIFSIVSWVLFGIFYLLFCVLDLQFCKKEIFLKISMGLPKYKAALLESFKDTLLLLGTAFVLKSILSQFFYTDFHLSLVLFVFASVIVLNFCIHLFSIYRMHYKEIIYGGHIGEQTVSNCYLVKVASMVLTVLLFSMNIALIGANIQPLVHAKEVKAYQDYSFAKLDVSKENLSEVDELPTYYRQLVTEGYQKGAVQISINNPFMGENGRPFIFTNNMDFLLKSGVRNFENHGENIIILPYNCTKEESKELLLSICSTCIEMNVGCKAEDIEYKVLTAQKPSKALYFDVKEPIHAQLGYVIAKNPVFMYCNTSQLEFCDAQNNFVNPECQNALFSKGFLENDFEFLQKSNVTLEAVRAEHVFNSHKMSLIKTVALSFSIIALQILIDLSLISALIRVEYSANCMELSLKKIMGYSVLTKNKSLIFLNVYAALIGIMIAVILFFLLQIPLKIVAVLSGLFVMSLEILIMLWAIERFERANVMKMIKGGAL